MFTVSVQGCRCESAFAEAGKRRDLLRRNKKTYKLGLALSGGGTKGVAHIGVWKALCEAQISVDVVAGTSAGSIVGALIAADISWEQMAEEAQLLTRKAIVNRRLLVGSDSQNIAAAVRRILGNKTFEELRLPFAAVAVDLQSGAEVVVNKGDVALATAASSSVPILFKPTLLEGKMLVDGGLLNNMPADVCRQMGADIVVGVDLNYARGKGTDSAKLADIAVATWNITTKNAMLKGQLNSDVIITPELGAYKNTTFDGIADRIEQGYIAAMEQIPHIKELLNTKF